MSRYTCHCAAYSFPHRPGGGACVACVDRDGRTSSQLCECCRLPATTRRVDFGIGLTEFWGRVSVHTDIQDVTACCEAGLVDNVPARSTAGAA